MAPYPGKTGNIVILISTQAGFLFLDFNLNGGGGTFAMIMIEANIPLSFYKININK